MVMMMVVMMYIKKEWNLHWFCFLIHTLTKKSWYVIAGSLLVLPILSTNYCPNEFYTILF